MERNRVRESRRRLAIPSSPPPYDGFPLSKNESVEGVLLCLPSVRSTKPSATSASTIPHGGALIVYDSIVGDDRTRNAFGLLMSLKMLIDIFGVFDYAVADCAGG
jgi:hypothetical protein